MSIFIWSQSIADQKLANRHSECWHSDFLVLKHRTRWQGGCKRLNCKLTLWHRAEGKWAMGAHAESKDAGSRKGNGVAILWLRTDLRVLDNEALLKAWQPCLSTVWILELVLHNPLFGKFCLMVKLSLIFYSVRGHIIIEVSNLLTQTLELNHTEIEIITTPEVCMQGHNRRECICHRLQSYTHYRAPVVTHTHYFTS